MTRLDPATDRYATVKAGGPAMNLFSAFKRVAQAFGLAALLAGPALAAEPTLKILPGGGIELPPGVADDLKSPERPLAPRPVVEFTKTGTQLSCLYARYDIRFGIRATPEFFDNPKSVELLASLKLDLTDQVPPGMRIVNASLSGDVTGAGGPAVEILEVADVDDTVQISDFRLSADDLDGSGGDRRELRLVVTAQLDPGAFAAPTVTLNQAGITASLKGGTTILVSHDPALPDDGTPETGEKTKVVIDLTGCDRTPPGGTPPEPCFKLVDGEIDCDRNGLGDFTYRLPMGPEMAGQTVELESLTPGITIAPASQVVPAGGGMLEWTISGASPGDTVELMITGIQSTGAPVEGLGLCCTQRITIVIPEDIRCPEPGTPDIKVVKRAVDTICRRDGSCDFVVRVSNAGTAPYTGPIAIEDVTGPGNGTIVSGPNAPWTCLPGISPVMCKHPPLTLNPGQFVDLKLGFRPGPGWNWDVIRNCAEYDYAASNQPAPFGKLTNDRSCASIPICGLRDPRCPNPDQPKADLSIVKVPAREGATTCLPNGFCIWRVNITNVGTTPYSGPLTVDDIVTAPAPSAVLVEPTPPWVCVSTGPGTLRCDLASITLAPGATASLAVGVNAANYPARAVENCVELKGVPNENNLANNRSCSTLGLGRPGGQADLSIRKECVAFNERGSRCRITVTNNGTAAPVGVVEVLDVAEMIGGGAPVPVLAVVPDGPEWTCSPVPAATLTCAIPGPLLAPGVTRSFDVGIPETNGEPARNCATGRVNGPGAEAAPFGQSCAEFGGSLRVEKSGELSCLAGGTCTFEIAITNGTGAPVNGPVHVIDRLSVNGANVEAPITAIAPPLGCAPEPGAVPIDCVATMAMEPGETRVHQVTIQLPANIAGQEGANGLNCFAALPNGPGGADGVAKALPAPEGIANDLPPFADCHGFRVAASRKTCTPPLILNENNKCVCPDGETYKNGTCVPIEGKPKPIVCSIPGQVPINGKCQCPSGQVVINGACKKPAIVCTIPGQVVSNGKCVCPKGTELINGACRKPRPQCEILGQFVDQNGRCVCPKGTVPIKGECRVPPVLCTIPGQIVVGGKCVCPEGTTVINGVCRKPRPQCEIAGQIVDQNGRCVCPKGTVPINGACRKPQPQCQIVGQIVDQNGRCVCPKGTQPIKGECRVPPQEPTCTVPGQVVVNGRCRCPKGQIVVNGKCGFPQLNLDRTLPEQSAPNERKVLPKLLINPQ